MTMPEVETIHLPDPDDPLAVTRNQLRAAGLRLEGDETAEELAEALDHLRPLDDDHGLGEP